jgi:glycerol-3-phosphate dehydrogenase
MNVMPQVAYDLVVIGGGIQGAGVALMAKKAGYSVLLIEKNTWASATSSASSKLIHGGLRYLQTGQFTLVYECLKERHWMLKTLPDLVKPSWFYLPIYQNAHYSTWKIHLGLFLYRFLSGNTAYSQYKKIPKNQWAALAGLQQEGLKAVFAYQDAQTDDAALTRYLVQQAQAIGVDCYEQTECVSATHHDTVFYQLHLQQKEQKKIYQVNCHSVVNATGPWVNRVLQMLDNQADDLAVELVQGSHLVVSPALSEDCFYLPAPQDNRAVFCLPWKGKTLVGTTELIYQGAPEDAHVTQQEVDYLSAVVKHYFPHYAFSIISSFCGLRVLPHSTQKVFSRPRDTLICKHHRIISLYGGKLTAWRATAVKVVMQIDEIFGRRSTVDIDNLFVDSKRQK